MVCRHLWPRDWSFQWVVSVNMYQTSITHQFLCQRGEVAPLVIGVPGAQYWRAPSQLVAHQQFADAEERGDVQVLFLA